MKLTNQEENERLYIQQLKSSRTIPFINVFLNERLIYLNRKEFHNCCSNPRCIGYEGNESETTCPKCNSKLYKLI
jgi:hypothetical protein